VYQHIPSTTKNELYPTRLTQSWGVLLSHDLVHGKPTSVDTCFTKT